jgi:hypothetical protein
MGMTRSEARAEHLAWCKARAFEYVDRGELANAVASMASDLTKHPDTGFNPTLMWLVMPHVAINDTAGVRRWIDGFMTESEAK